jgi:hypothetical protein
MKFRFKMRISGVASALDPFEAQQLNSKLARSIPQESTLNSRQIQNLKSKKRAFEFFV